MAQGKDASELFPAVVKNVVSKNIEVNLILYFKLLCYISIFGKLASSSVKSQVYFFWSPILQVKKLVYVYLVRYAEEQQDLALLSISTFQRALKVNM